MATTLSSPVTNPCSTSTGNDSQEEQYLGPPALKKHKVLPKDVTASLRKEFISPSLSVHYSKVGALDIVYGKGAYLYDEKDQAYLDCINNVTQVGHCHPRVVEAFSSQLSTLSASQYTSSDQLDAYTTHLLSHFPESFGHIFFTNSGTEANDLALHIAECVTGHTEVVSLEGAYHGHSKHLIGLSTYKLRQQKENNSLRVNPRAWVAPMPDSFRGIHKGEGAGKKYADEIQSIISKAQAQGKQVASFLAEAFLGCGGQIQLPQGFLKESFEYVHKAGGLCIIDEVQTGFGRAGDYFWLHESQGVVPDMVTIGKPMGNGHPVSAVVTTREIAERYKQVVGENTMKTYRGSPVALAVAEAVLTTIEVERMQASAKNLGDYIKKKVTDMMDKHSCIGDIRGFGLFLGVEIVKDRTSREPNGTLCTDIVHKVLLDHHIMIKEDGINNNVIKIKPPLCFTQQDADKLLTALDRVMTDLSV